MPDRSDDSSPPAGAVTGAPAPLWSASAAVAAFGAGVLFDAAPGINWVLWTSAAVAGLLVSIDRGAVSGAPCWSWPVHRS